MKPKTKHTSPDIYPLTDVDWEYRGPVEDDWPTQTIRWETPDGRMCTEIFAIRPDGTVICLGEVL